MTQNESSKMRPTDLQNLIYTTLSKNTSGKSKKEVVEILLSEGELAAKFFAKFRNCDDEPAHISFLPILDEAGLLKAHVIDSNRLVNTNSEGNKKHIIPLVSWRATSANLMSKEGSYYCEWLSQHVDKVEFIDWVLKNGGIFHPHLKHTISWQMWSGGKQYKSKGQKTPFASILQILTNYDIMHDGYSDVDYYLLEKALSNDKKGISPGLKQKMISLLSPKISVTGKTFSEEKAFYKKIYTAASSKKEVLPDDVMGNLFKLEKAQDYHLKQVVEHIYKKREWLSDIAPDAYALLKRTFDILALIKEGNSTYIFRPSIEPHDQNRNYSDWDSLVDLLRDSLISLLGNNSIKGEALLKLMLEEGSRKNLKNGHKDENSFPIFMRIALYALAQNPSKSSPHLNLELALNYIDSWLYTNEGKKEGCDLLQSVWSSDSLTLKLRRKVISKIMKGPPEVNNSRKKDDLEYKKHQIFIRLNWLADSKGPLTERGEREYKKLLNKFGDQGSNPLYKIASYVKTSAGPKNPDKCVSNEEFEEASVHTHISWLKENDQGRSSIKEKNNISSLWLELFKQDPKKMFSLAEEIGRSGYWSKSIFGPIGYEFAKLDGKDHDWQTYFAILQKIPNDSLKEFLYESTWALRYFGESSNDRKKTDKSEFLKTWGHILPIAKEYDKESSKSSSVDVAINHPVGHLTEALIGFMSFESERKRGDISRSYGNHFDMLLHGKSNSLAYAKIILSRSLFPMFVLMPEWTKNNILPLLDWERCSAAPIYWSAFLHNPRLSKDLIENIQEYMANAFKNKHLEKLDNPTIRANLVRLIAIMFIEGDFSEKDTNKILQALSKKDKSSVFNLYLDRLENEKRNKSSEWNQILKWILKYQDHGFRSSSISYKIVRMLLCLDEREFKNAYAKAKHIITNIDENLFLVLNKLVDQDQKTRSGHYLWNDPELLLDLISKITPTTPHNQAFIEGYLKVLLKELGDYKAKESYLIINDAYLKMI